MSVTLSPTKFVDFPTHEERPTSHVVIYDGKCNFCRQQMDRIHRFDRFEKFAYLSLHDDRVSSQWPDLTRDELMQEICVVTTEGKRHHGADAFRFIVSELPSLRWASWAMRIPFSMPLWRFLYRQFARQRYRLSGDCDCQPSASDRVELSCEVGKPR